MAIVIALLEFNDLGCSVTANRFYLQLSPHCPKMNKKSMWEVSRFLYSGHGILPVKLRSLNANLFFKEPQQLTKFT